MSDNKDIHSPSDQPEDNEQPRTEAHANVASEQDLRRAETVYNTSSNVKDREFAANPEVIVKRPPLLLWFCLGILLLLALAVVFVLPGVVEQYELPLEPRQPVAITSVSPQPQVSSTEAISPFQQAQIAQQRKDAQDVLAQLLEVQSELQGLEVEQWAAKDYQAALAVADQGDEAYREQEFESAKGFYQQSLTNLQELQQSGSGVASALVEAGQQALAEFSSEEALQNFSLALAIDAGSPIAQEGYQRAETLDEVIALVESATTSMEEGDFEQSKLLFQRAFVLDPKFPDIANLIQDAETANQRAKFTAIMSEGFRNLERGNPQQALEAFNRALATGFNNSQAEAAIQQTETDLAAAIITRLRARIIAAEAGENWQQSLDLHNEILAVDSNLVFATQGADHAGKRLQLDNLLEGSIANPLRMTEEAIYQQVLDIYYTATNIPSPGPRLKDQIERLQPLLDASQIPEEVTVISDELTEVTLLRVATLGLLRNQSLNLQPGEYVLVGRRQGFREVRREFVVGFGQTPSNVTVICDEEVAVSSRR